MARATGSYPVGHGFKSNLRYLVSIVDGLFNDAYASLNVGFADIFGPLVKRLRHRPFTAVTWVRFPYGSPNVTNPNYFVNRNWFGFVFYFDYPY